MFDKIFKTALLLILAFIAYTFYLYTLNTRYRAVTNYLVMDRQTGKTYFMEHIQRKIEADKKQEAAARREAIDIANEALRKLEAENDSGFNSK